MTDAADGRGQVDHVFVVRVLSVLSVLSFRSAVIVSRLLTFFVWIIRLDMNLTYD